MDSGQFSEAPEFCYCFHPAHDPGACEYCDCKYVEGLCLRCNKRKATETFAFDMLAFTHGGGKPYCEQCIIEEQLEYARGQAARVPELEKQLMELANDPGPGNSG